MAVVQMKECKRPPLKVRDDGTLHGTRSFEFLSDDDTTTISDLIAYAGFPARGDSHPDHPAALLRDFEPELVDGFHNLHILTCNYDSKQQFDENDNSTSALIKAGFRAQDRQVPAVFDAFGRPNVNTARDIIPGLVRVVNEYVAPVTVKLSTVPLYVFTLNNTLNAAAITFRGINFPPGTLMLKNMNMADSPEQATDGTWYWVVTYDLIHNPDGFYEIHPNKGKHELVYQVRSGGSADWEDSDPATYDSKSPISDRRIVKRRIRGDDDQAAADDVWLDARGRAVKVPTISTSILGTGTTTVDSKTLTLNTGSFQTDGSQDGASIAIVGAGPHGRTLHTLIDTVGSSSSATLIDAARTAVSASDVYLPGVIGLRIQNQPLADWTAVATPNNDP